MSYGIKISKYNYDVKTTDIVNLSMTSQKNSLKIFMEGEFSQAVQPYPTGDLYTITIPHNLGYEPAIRVYGQHNPGESKYFQYPNEYGIGYILGFCSSDSTNLYIYLSSGTLTTPGTIYGYYYIFEDEQ